MLYVLPKQSSEGPAHTIFKKLQYIEKGAMGNNSENKRNLFQKIYFLGRYWGQQ